MSQVVNSFKEQFKSRRLSKHGLRRGEHLTDKQYRDEVAPGKVKRICILCAKNPVHSTPVVGSAVKECVHYFKVCLDCHSGLPEQVCCDCDAAFKPTDGSVGRQLRCGTCLKIYFDKKFGKVL